LNPIKKKSRLYHEVINEIFSSISKEKLKPGDKLPSERMIAELLEVSRTTVKEAISVLEANGIVVIKPGVGVFLAERSKKKIQKELLTVLNVEKGGLIELLELRQAIEGDAAYYAAQRMTQKERVELEKCFHRLQDAEQNGKLAIDEDFAFHKAIIAGANNAVMADLMEVISEKVYSFIRQNRMETLLEPAEIHVVTEEHRAVYEAILNKDGQSARTAMWEHLQSIKVRHNYE